MISGSFARFFHVLSVPPLALPTPRWRLDSPRGMNHHEMHGSLCESTSCRGTFLGRCRSKVGLIAGEMAGGVVLDVVLDVGSIGLGPTPAMAQPGRTQCVAEVTRLLLDVA